MYLYEISAYAVHGTIDRTYYGKKAEALKEGSSAHREGDYVYVVASKVETGELGTRELACAMLNGEPWKSEDEEELQTWGDKDDVDFDGSEEDEDSETDDEEDGDEDGENEDTCSECGGSDLDDEGDCYDCDYDDEE